MKIIKSHCSNAAVMAETQNTTRQGALEFVRQIERKWQDIWQSSKVFHSEPVPGKPKWFGNYPYSYMNGRAHIGHAFTLTRVEFMARYKRMKGYNVLFPFAFHYTGSPIVGAAQRIKSGDESQKEILREQGVPENEIPEFSDPLKWIEYFPKIWESEVRALGLSIDWRRKFHTTELNPFYDIFVQWQFRKLRERGYVTLGSHPVVWCLSCNGPVGDHDRVGGEGERAAPVEHTLLKFRCGDFYLIAATLRPETIYGQTNVWIDPDVTYSIIEICPSGTVGDGCVDSPAEPTAEKNGVRERWVVSPECVRKLKNQRHPEAREKGTVKGIDLIGKYVSAPGIRRMIPVLPSQFCDPAIGTGIVTSVPSDSPDDWIALQDLKNSHEECAKYGLDHEKIMAIEPIAIIKTKGFGDFPAAETCRKLGVRNQNDREKLENAKELVYKSGFYTGIMNETCGQYSGLPVSRAKEEIRAWLIGEGYADIMYEISTRVTCRCLTEAIVKLVSNQWFIKYSDPSWKRRVKMAFGGEFTERPDCESDDIDGCRPEQTIALYPETVRRQFHNVIDWLGDWACTREYGLGTRLPWDRRWIIESLSDSTIYMAYYTIAHILHHEKAVPAKNISDAFFDFVLLGTGTAEAAAEQTGIAPELLKRMRDEFLYWYPFDFRNSGKDLVQNHLTFCVFNHVAIFPPEHWPRGFGVNGWILVDGQKMSKSLGTQINLGDALEKYGADATRLALANAGEGLDDPTFDTQFASGAALRLIQWHDFAVNWWGKGRVNEKTIDRWLRTRIAQLVAETTEAMEQTRFRSALKSCYFDMQAAYRWYVERCGKDGPGMEVLKEFIETQTLMLAPFAPHICEEIWHAIGKEGLISFAKYPKTGSVNIDDGVIAAEDYLKSVIEDTSQILKIFKGTPKKVTYFTAPGWKRKVFAQAISMHIETGKVDTGNLIKSLMTRPELKKYAAEIPKFARRCADDIRKMNPGALRRCASVVFDETAFLQEVSVFIADKLGVAVEAVSADAPGISDPAGKATQATPWRPGIFVE